MILLLDRLWGEIAKSESCAIYFLKAANENYHCSMFLLTLTLSIFLPRAMVSSFDFNSDFPDD